MFVQRLLHRSIPGYVNRLAGMGSMVSCLMPQSLSGQAPVNDGNSSSGSSSTAPVRNSQPTSFGGSGNKLGEC